MKRFAVTVVLIFITSAVNAQIYQWKDENGKTTLSDKPPPGQLRPQQLIDSESSTPATKTPSQKTLADRDLEFRKRQKESQESAEKASKVQAASAEKEENCDNAQRQLQALESGERIALRNNKGERYFLEDSQREQEIAKARLAVQSNCK